jgi:hypothetical protein
MLLVVGACPPPEPPPLPIPPVSTGKVRVRVFTEPSESRLVVATDKLVFVATDDELQRWDDTGNVLALSADHGLPGSHVVALAPDPDRHWLWILTEGGFGHYDTKDETYSELVAPPAALGLDYTALAKDVVALAPATEPGVWLGSSKGLVFVTEKGGWVPTAVKDPVRAMHRDRAGWLWLATKDGLVARKPSGDVVKVGATQGCVVVDPRLIREAPDDRVLVIGNDAEGHERIAIGKQLQWASYRTLPEVTWDAAARRGANLVVMGGGRLYRIGAASTAGVRPLARDGMRLVPLTTGAPDWVIDPLDVVLPPGPTVLAATADEQLLVGTHDLGTARYATGDVHPRSWLRRKQMFEDANTLTVACARQQDCWISTGAGQAWHWTGDRFIAGGPDQVVLAVARDPSGPIYALHRTANEHELRLSKLEGTTWVPVEKVALTTPGDKPEASFVRFAASGSLWIGLRYRDGEERRPYGIAIVEPGAGKVTYHRTEAVPDKKQKMLPIPVGVVDADVRGDIAWFATNEGIARLAGGKVKIWTEADGLVSELARAVTFAYDRVIVATGAGAGVWDGKGWDFPAALRFEINDVVATHNGQVWMATERGIAAWDGSKVRRVDTRRGLAENMVLDVVSDQFDRVWARGPGSLTLVSQ